MWYLTHKTVTIIPQYYVKCNTNFLSRKSCNLIVKMIKSNNE